MNINEINTSVSISVPIPLDENVEKYSYSEIVIQLIKYILHVRRQIPFNYDTFSYLMNKNKHKYDGNVNTTNVLAARRYKIYEATLKSLNNLFQVCIIDVIVYLIHIITNIFVESTKRDYYKF